MVTNVKPNTGRPSDGSSAHAGVPPDSPPPLVPLSTFASTFVSTFASRWGNWAPNRLADRAGRHRRLAIGCALLTVPFLVMAANPAAAYHDKLFATSKVLVGLSFLWVARDLIGTGSLIGGGVLRLPHMSVVSLAGSFALFHRHRNDHFESLIEAQPLLRPGIILFGVAVVVLAVDDRRQRPSQLGGFAGRLLLVCGASIVGLASIGAMFAGYLSPPAYSLGVSSAGVLLIGMAVFEGRLLWRALALFDSMS